MQRYKRVTLETRCQIKAFLEIKISIREIARRLNRHRSTIYRELRRNGRDGVYSAEVASALARDRFKSCRRKRIFVSPEVLRLVEVGLKEDWSPDQIAKRSRCFSRQTIYNEIRRSKPEWKKQLRRYGKTRGRGRWKRRGPSWKLSIHDRPAEANERKIFGHWERDTFFTKDRKQLIALQERKSRFIKIEKVIEPYSVFLTLQTKNMMKNEKVLSFTNDHGNEFMDGEHFEHPVYYCDPHSPHQKGSVENAIGLIRQYITRKTDLSQLTELEIQKVADKLNHRPRRCLDYRTPHEVFYEQAVALGS